MLLGGSQVDLRRIFSNDIYFARLARAAVPFFVFNYRVIHAIIGLAFGREFGLFMKRRRRIGSHGIL